MEIVKQEPITRCPTTRCEPVIYFNCVFCDEIFGLKETLIQHQIAVHNTPISIKTIKNEEIPSHFEPFETHNVSQSYSYNQGIS